jgi:cyanate lyase
MEESSARAEVVRSLMDAKAESGKSFSDVAAETGLTNVYVAQLLRRQAQLKPDTAPKLRAALPALTDDLVNLMMQPPFRSYHPDIVHEPAIYRCPEPPSILPSAPVYEDVANCLFLTVSVIGNTCLCRC